MSNQEIYSIILYQNIVLQNKLCKLSPILLMRLCLFGHSKKSLILGCICKVVNSIYKKYVTFISQIRLNPSRTISEISDICFSFATLCQCSSQEKIVFIVAALGDILLNLLCPFIFLKKISNVFLNSFQVYLNLNFPELYHLFLYGFNGWGSSASSLQSHYNALKG